MSVTWQTMFGNSLTMVALIRALHFQSIASNQNPNNHTEIFHTNTEDEQSKCINFEKVSRPKCNDRWKCAKITYLILCEYFYRFMFNILLQSIFLFVRYFFRRLCVWCDFFHWNIRLQRIWNGKEIAQTQRTNESRKNQQQSQ